jgi:hypothetical protein
MKNYKILLLVIALIFIIVSVFSTVISYKVITHFNSNEIYDLIMFKNDLELAIIIMIANVIGDLFLVYYVWKNKLLSNLFNSKTNNNDSA